MVGPSRRRVLLKVELRAELEEPGHQDVSGVQELVEALLISEYRVRVEGVVEIQVQPRTGARTAKTGSPAGRLTRVVLADGTEVGNN